mmetsp:Transcript_11473/g.27429  ORF Transcript_11473/g.27429 Transcript_11473/m.27429 type:complete len:185 (-) Transcript_11473:314-868(-)
MFDTASFSSLSMFAVPVSSVDISLIIISLQTMTDSIPVSKTTRCSPYVNDCAIRLDDDDNHVRTAVSIVVTDTTTTAAVLRSGIDNRTPYKTTVIVIRPGNGSVQVDVRYGVYKTTTVQYFMNDIVDGNDDDGSGVTARSIETKSVGIMTILINNPDGTPDGDVDGDDVDEDGDDDGLQYIVRT